MISPNPLRRLARLSRLAYGDLRCQQQVTSHLTHDLVEDEFVVTHSSSHEAETKTEKLCGQNRPKNSSLNNGELVGPEKDNEHDNLDDGSKGCLQQNTEHFVELPGQFLSSKANQIGTWDHGNVIEDEDDEWEVGASVSDSNCCWDDWPEDVADARGSACGTPADSQEVKGVETFPTTLSSRLDARGDTVVVGIVIVSWEDGVRGGISHVS